MNELDTVRDRFAEVIRAIPSLQAFPVLTEKKGNINATIQQALAKLGMSIVAIAPDADDVVRDGESLRLRLRLVAEVTENVLINSGKTPYVPALTAVNDIVKAVDQSPNGLDPEGQRHISGQNEFEIDPDKPFTLVPDATAVVYHVTAYTTIFL